MSSNLENLLVDLETMLLRPLGRHELAVAANLPEKEVEVALKLEKRVQLHWKDMEASCRQAASSTGQAGAASVRHCLMLKRLICTAVTVT